MKVKDFKNVARGIEVKVQVLKKHLSTDYEESTCLICDINDEYDNYEILRIYLDDYNHDGINTLVIANV